MDRSSASVEHAMRGGEIDGVVVAPPMVVIRGEVLLHEASVGKNGAQVRTGRGRAAWGRWAVDRSLILAKQPLPQKSIASATGVSQQAVSQALQDHPLVQRVEDGWRVDDRSALVERWLVDYPGSGGATTYWYALQPVLQQGSDALGLAKELAAEPLLSGDSAADEYAPWRLPTQLSSTCVKQSTSHPSDSVRPQSRTPQWPQLSPRTQRSGPWHGRSATRRAIWSIH